MVGGNGRKEGGGGWGEKWVKKSGGRGKNDETDTGGGRVCVCV